LAACASRLLPPRSPPAEANDSWLLGAISAEMLVHSLIFACVLVPVLGAWLPGLLIYVSLAAAATVLSIGTTGGWIATLPVLALLVAMPLGFGARRRSLIESDAQAAATWLKLGAAEYASAMSKLSAIWSQARGRPSDLPRLVCRPHFGVLAHAYDCNGERTIEVSVGLMSRLLRDDPVANAILRHELAHLIYNDLPRMRLQSQLVGACQYSIISAGVACGLATLVMAIAGLVGQLQSAPSVSFGGLVLGLVALLAFMATISVVLPIGAYALRRYAGFIIALMELRADASAGHAGEGLKKFSQDLERDTSIRPTTFWDYGLAYLSTSLSHIPVQDRSRLLADEERLATPKMRYLAIAVIATWLLGFHQGTSILGWDFFLLALLVAVLYGITLFMLAAPRGRLPLSPKRCATLALVLVSAQALAFISLEGFAYLAQHLSAAIAMPGGFGSAENASYVRDTWDTLAEFSGKAWTATGGFGLLLAFAIVAAGIYAFSRLRLAELGTAGLVSIVCAAPIASMVVSYGFFQGAIYAALRDLSFRVSSPLLYKWSLVFHGPAFLDAAPWLKLALPLTCCVTLAACLVAVRDVARSEYVPWRRS